MSISFSQQKKAMTRVLLVMSCLYHIMSASFTCNDAPGYYTVSGASGCGGISCCGTFPIAQCCSPGTGNCYSCARCRTSCNIGQYFTPCIANGNLLRDTSTCTNCTSSCPVGQELSGTCSGSSTSDTTSCVPIVASTSTNQISTNNPTTIPSATPGLHSLSCPLLSFPLAHSLFCYAFINSGFCIVWRKFSFKYGRVIWTRFCQ